MKNKKRTPEQTQAAVNEAKTLLKANPELTVAEVLKGLNLQPSTWYKYKDKRKPYAKSSPSVERVTPIEAQGIVDMAGGKRRWYVLTDDAELVSRILRGDL